MRAGPRSSWYGDAVSDGLQAGLRRAAAAFGAESVTFRAIMPPDGPACADGGSPEFGAALARVLGTIGERHTRLAAGIAGYSRTLREACQDYRAAQEAIGDMIDRILDPGAPG